MLKKEINLARIKRLKKELEYSKSYQELLKKTNFYKDYLIEFATNIPLPYLLPKSEVTELLTEYISVKN